MAVSSSLDAGGVAAIMILAPSLSSRCLSPGSSHPLAPAQLVSWIPATRPGMTPLLGRLADGDARLGQLCQHRPRVLEDRRPVRHDARLVLEVAVALHLLPQRPQYRREVLLRLDRDARHAWSFTWLVVRLVLERVAAPLHQHGAV